MICGIILLLFGGVLGRVIVDENFGTGSDTGGNWNYQCHNEDPTQLGPYDWKKEYPECKGYSQSPILLPTVFADMSFLDRLEYDGFWDNQFSWNLENEDGRAFMIKVPDNVKIRPSVTTIAGKFFLNATVFRYGKYSCYGSEHGMNGRMYPAEVQSFYMSSEYDNFWEAAKVPGKIAIVSHILEVSEEDNHGFDGLLDNLHHINGTNKPYSLDWYAKVLFQEEGKKCNNCDYYFYEGSLSFPPCNEVVLWFVMMKTIPISERQLNVLRSVLSSTTQKPMVGNDRVPQPANFRDILQHRELDFKSYDNYKPGPPPMMPPPGAYPKGVRPPPPGVYPPAYWQDPSGNSAGGQDAYPQPYPHQPYPHQPYPNQPYPNEPYPNEPYPNEPYPNRYPYPPPSHYPYPTTASPNTPHPTKEPNYPPYYNQPTPPERYYRHPNPPQYKPTNSPYHKTTTTTATTTTATTTTEKPYKHPYPDYNPRTDTHEHQQYPRFDPHIRARG